MWHIHYITVENNTRKVLFLKKYIQVVFFYWETLRNVQGFGTHRHSHVWWRSGPILAKIRLQTSATIISDYIQLYSLWCKSVWRITFLLRHEPNNAKDLLIITSFAPCICLFTQCTNLPLSPPVPLCGILFLSLRAQPRDLCPAACWGSRKNNRSQAFSIIRYFSSAFTSE